MKLLKAKTEHLVAGESSDDFSVAEKLLGNLKVQFDVFLKDVSNLDEFKSKNPLEGIKTVSGDALIEDEFGVAGKSPYLFLRIPGRPGLLIEPEDRQTLALVAATEAKPFQKQWSGETTSQTVFVRKPNPIATFKIIDGDVVRDLSLGKTLVGVQFFEKLVERLVVHINDRSV